MTPSRPGEETFLGLHVHERHLEVLGERLDDLRGLVLAQEAVVDEHARELVADGPCRTISAATALSTPPERPQRTRSLPTRPRIRSTCSSMTAAGVQTGEAPATP